MLVVAGEWTNQTAGYFGHFLMYVFNMFLQITIFCEGLLANVTFVIFQIQMNSIRVRFQKTIHFLADNGKPDCH